MKGPQQQYSTAGNIRVLARVRPQLPHEYQYDHAVEVPSAAQIKLQNTKQSYESSYDRVLPDTSSQEHVYSQVSGCIPSLLQGYNNTIFAYGQTGTGKTYTMIGDQSMTLAEACSTPSSTSGHGILSRAVYDLFAELDQRKAAAASTGQEYDIKLVCSYLEIYNDRLYDLLQPYKKASNSCCMDPLRIQLGKTSLEVREDPVAGTHVPNLLYVDVQSCKQVLQLVATGNSNRATAHTDMNRHSSRSHAILQLWLEQRPSAAASGNQHSKTAGIVVRSKMNFVDLAGSERWGKAHTEAEGRTLINELTSINNSLSALAMVVSALTDKTAKHVPYRSSRLTHLLQDSLGGNCNTTLIVTVAPCVDAYEDSMAALKFADRARNIANKAVVNSMHDTETILALKEREIQRLRALLASYTGASTAGSPSPSVTQPGNQGQWSAGVLDQDGLLLPSSHPGTPSSLHSSSSTDSRRQLSHLSATNNSDAQSTAADASTAGEDPAAAAAAADRTRLESELAAMRAALELERNMRSALEGQLQEATAAAQAQQQAAAAAAVAAAQAQQQATAAQAQTQERMAVSAAAAPTSTEGLARTSGGASANAVDGVSPTGRSSLLVHNAAHQSPVALADPAWPMLDSPTQQQRQWQKPQPSLKESYRGKGQQQQQDQGLQQHSPKKRQPSRWNDNWQGSIEEHIRASHNWHKQQDSNKGTSRSNTGSPVSPRIERAKTPTGKVSSNSKSAYETRDSSNPLRSSWSEAYGASGGLRGKWPTSLPAGAATSRSPTNSSRVLGGVLAGGSRPSRAAATAVRAGSKSLLQDRASGLASDGVLQQIVRSASSPNALKHALDANSKNGSIVVGPATGSSGLLKQQQQQQQQHSQASVMPRRPSGSLQQPVEVAGLPQQQQQPVQQGWGRSWLLQQAKLQSQQSTAAAPTAAAAAAAPLAVAPAAVRKHDVPLAGARQQQHDVGNYTGSANPAVADSAVGPSKQQQPHEQLQVPQQQQQQHAEDSDRPRSAGSPALDGSVAGIEEEPEAYSESFCDDADDSKGHGAAEEVPEPSDGQMSNYFADNGSAKTSSMSGQQQQWIEHISSQTGLQTDSQALHSEPGSLSQHDTFSGSAVGVPIVEAGVQQQSLVGQHDPQTEGHQNITFAPDDKQLQEAGQQMAPQQPGDEPTEDHAEANLLLQPAEQQAKQQSLGHHLPAPIQQQDVEQQQAGGQHEEAMQLSDPAHQQTGLQLGTAEQQPQQSAARHQTVDVQDPAASNDIDDELLMAEQQSLMLMDKAIKSVRRSRTQGF